MFSKCGPGMAMQCLKELVPHTDLHLTVIKRAELDITCIHCLHLRSFLVFALTQLIVSKQRDGHGLGLLILCMVYCGLAFHNQDIQLSSM